MHVPPVPYWKSHTALPPAPLPPPPPGPHPLPTPQAAAPLVSNKMRMAVVRSDEVISSFEMPTTSVSLALYKSFDDGKEVYSAPLTDLTSWLLVRADPTVMHLDW